MKNILFFVTLAVFISISVNAQQTTSTTKNPSATSPLLYPTIPSDTIGLTQSYGLDILFSTNGFGLGLFYRCDLNKTIQGFASFAISESKDESEFDQYDPYTGESYSPGEINRFLIFPLSFGIQYRIFEDEIMDNFRPYLTAGAGPTVVFSSPYDREFFNSLRYGKAYWTYNSFIGLGAFFGNQRGSFLGFNFRYYFIPIAGGLPSMQNQVTGDIMNKKDFGGFFISLTLGTSY